MSPQRPIDATVTPCMVLLIENGVEGVVKRAAKSHKKNLSVSAEASALLRTLGMDPITSDASAPSASALPPPPPPSVGAVVTIGADTKASVLCVFDFERTTDA